MTDTKEPHTAEEWTEWAANQSISPFPRVTISKSILREAIRRAQEQARHEAIEECAKIVEFCYQARYGVSHLSIYTSDLDNRIRALLDKS